MNYCLINEVACRKYLEHSLLPCWHSPWVYCDPDSCHSGNHSVVLSLPVLSVGNPEGPRSGPHPVTFGNWWISNPASLTLQWDISKECCSPSPISCQLKWVTVTRSYTGSLPHLMLASFPSLLPFFNSLPRLFGIISQTSLCSDTFQVSDSGETQSKTLPFDCWDIIPGNQSMGRDVQNKRSYPEGLFLKENVSTAQQLQDKLI